MEGLERRGTRIAPAWVSHIHPSQSRRLRSKRNRLGVPARCWRALAPVLQVLPALPRQASPILPPPPPLELGTPPPTVPPAHPDLHLEACTHAHAWHVLSVVQPYSAFSSQLKTHFLGESLLAPCTWAPQHSPRGVTCVTVIVDAPHPTPGGKQPRLSCPALHPSPSPSCTYAQP